LPKIYCLNFKDNDKVALRGATFFSGSPFLLLKLLKMGSVPLPSFGTQLGTAIRASLNRSGPWAMSRRLAAQTGLTNQKLKEQGLLSVKELWVKIHYPATAR
jgi:hypothetical protein